MKAMGLPVVHLFRDMKLSGGLIGTLGRGLGTLGRGLTRIMYTLVLCVSVLGVMGGLTACAPHSVKTTEGYALLEEGKLFVVAALDNPPYEYYEGSNPTGYGVAVVQELASRMGLECQIRSCDAVNHEEGVTKCLTTLEDDAADVALASFTARSLESANVDYTIPYYEANQSIVVRNDQSIVARSELADGTYAVGALADSSSYRYACVNVSKEVKTYRNLADCVNALSSGEVAALVLDANQANRLLAEHPIDQTTGKPAFKELEQVIVADRFVLAVSRIDTGLADALSKEIKAMQEDGTLDRLVKEYL